ncbi:MAG TPA: outer membrane beta-barrel protein [Bacteriovoracaceae bacterium]|nr:outer membrane beta-barrel protein [Bacteriovoracaceae bacterium]
MKYLTSAFLLFPFAAQAAGSSAAKLTFEPLYGIETAMVRYPEPSRYVTRATYGARVLYGTTLLSGELEVTQAKSRKDYPGIDQKVEDTSDRAGLGLRSTLALNSFIGIYFRAGGRASQGKTVVTTAGVDETFDNPFRLDPYAGAGLQLALAPNMAVNAGVTLVKNGENKYDSQYTLGLSARFGNR